MRISWIAMSRCCLVVFACFVFVFTGRVPGMMMNVSASQVENHLGRQNTAPLKVTVILERIYLDGEISEEVIQETCWSKENFWAKYDQWRLIDMDGSTMVFRKQVDDISPLLKANGYFGITEDGVLTIFNGRPDQLRIIQSFFQIDIKKLESKKQEELLQGIPIKTKDRYVEVLETFKQYSKPQE
jgi:forespore regulator of the sigma-K checkpoint